MIVSVGWKSHLTKPRATVGVIVNVYGCRAVRSNVLQRQPGLILSGCMRREAAEDDNCDSNQHCCEQTYGSVAVVVDVFHKSRVTSHFVKCQVKKRPRDIESSYLGHTNKSHLPMHTSQVDAGLARNLGRLLRRLLEKIYRCESTAWSTR